MTLTHAVWDIDGVLSKGKVLKKVDDESIFDGEEQNLALWQQFLREKGIQSLAVTGRSLAVSQKFIDRYMDLDSVCEHGTMVIDPEVGPRHIAESDAKYKHLNDARLALEDAIPMMKGQEGQIVKLAGGNHIFQRADNLHILTYEFDHPDGEEFSQRLANHIVTNYFPEELQEAYRTGAIKALTSAGALDIMPAVSKKQGLEVVLNKIQVPTNQIVVAGDSFHSDHPMMTAVPDGVWICPGNSDDRLKEVVQARGDRGYVAEAPFFEGTMEALQHLDAKGYFRE